IGQKQHGSLLAAKPVPSDVGIVMVPETQIHNYCRAGDVLHYTQSIRGTYLTMLYQNLQVDFVPADDIPNHLTALYLPYPVMLPADIANRLKEWVRMGGTLISEGCPGYFGDRGRAGTVQPNLGLDELFGARESFVQFTPDLLEELVVTLNDGTKVDGGIYLQTYEPTSGEAFAHDGDGRIVGVQNQFGKGRTILLGTFPGSRAIDGKRNREYFARVFEWSGRKAAVEGDESRLIARLQFNDEDGKHYLWVVNATRKPLKGKFTIGQPWAKPRSITTLRGTASLLDDHSLDVAVAAREVTIVAW
ncbi:MAG: beta-galactosidase trimerization domain-containing protein, partial [Verrucomicrobiota bacterium]